MRIYLQGDLGTGKTTWTRAFLQALGVTQTITSPTYSLLHTYDTPTKLGLGAALHMDLYRLNDNNPEELIESGLLEALEGPGLHLVEWPEQAASCLPLPDCVIQFHLATPTSASISQNEEAHPRVMTLSAYSDQGLAWLDGLQKALNEPPTLDSLRGLCPGIDPSVPNDPETATWPGGCGPASHLS